MNAEVTGTLGAAAGLGLSFSALGHAIRALENRFGVRLLHSLGPALDEVARGLSALADWRGEPSGMVGLTTFAYAARSVLDPALPGFLLGHPKVSVEVSVDDRLADLVAAGFDAGIRRGEAVEPDMVAVRVAPDPRTVVVGTPGYFERHPMPGTPAAGAA